MRMCMMTLAVWLTCAGVSLGGSLDKEKLRKLVALPHISVTFEFPGSVVDAAKEKPTQEMIDAILRKMKGDASDARRYARLGGYYDDRNDATHARAAYGKAVKLYQDQIKQSPNDGVLHARLAEALRYLNRDEEAELVLRRALRLAPGSAECSIGLAMSLAKKVRGLLFDRKGLPLSLSLEEKVKRLHVSPPSPQEQAEIRQLLAESRSFMDRAVTQEPNNVEVYETRMGWHKIDAFYKCCLRFLAGEKIDPCKESLRAAATPAFMKDMYEVYSRKEPTRSKDIGVRIFLEVCLAPKKPAGGRENKGPLFDHLPPSAQRTIRAQLKILEEWMKGTDTKKAAQAAELHGMAYLFLFEDARIAEASLRRAVALDPSCKDARELLVFGLTEEGRFDDAVKIQEGALRLQDSAHDRFCLAKVLEASKRYNEAQQQLLHGLRCDPRDVMCNLGLAALLMRSGGETSLQQAKTYLEQAKTVLQKHFSKEQLAEYYLLCGVYQGLCDMQEDARSLLEQAAQKGASERAKKVLAVLSRKSPGKN
jgi:cytochrome c-type biogenesis protein CcmH/NrfG